MAKDPLEDYLSSRTKKRVDSLFTLRFKFSCLAKTQQGEEKRYQQRFPEWVVQEDEKNNIDEKFFMFNRREKEEQQIVSKEKNLNELQTIAEKGIQKFHDSTHNFQKEKVDKIINIFESRVNDNIVPHPFSKYAEELAIYFEEILCKNLETTTALKKEVEKLGNELNNLQLLIRDSKQGNEQLKFNKHPSITSTDLNVQNERVVDQIEMKDELKNAKINEDSLYDLIYENDVLNVKLRNISKERDTLRNRFISNQRKIYQKSDFKSFLLEKMLFALQSKNIFPEIPTQHAILPKRKERKDISPVKDIPKSPLMIKIEGKSLSSH
ncbi:uncharacterized protein [Parasteatoda tepidariorum]|uniref:uncharacterized protein n=1 Tax=Parasteatoda tepidariorum TaxID=114398 RepID=UPI0039BD5B20